MYCKKIVGKNIYLSPVDIDAEKSKLTLWFNEDEDIANNNGFYAKVLNEDGVLKLLESWSENALQLSIVTKDDEFIGHISLFGIDKRYTFATLGIYIGKQYRGKGYGKEAINLVLDYAFNTLNIKAIHLEVFDYNKKAYKLYKELGFKKCGIYHKIRYHQGEYHDVILMEILKEDY